MDSTNHCELFGTLEKLEQFNTLSKNIVPGSLVFESPSPFWGYYSDDPHDNHLLSYIYIAILPTYDVFEVGRAAQKVREELGLDLDAAKADIKFNERQFSVIRLRHIGDYTNVKEIQEAFTKHGVSMLMASGHWQNVTAHVKLRKIFGIKKLAEGIYIDEFEPNHAYLEIPSKLTFEEFTAVTQKVRNNWLHYKFDAALGAFLMDQKVEEVVRIYSEHLELETLLGIQKLYLLKMLRS